MVGKIGDVSRHPVLPDGALPDATRIGRPLAEGETISQSELPLYITTVAHSGVTLGLAGGGAVYIAANSLAEVRELAYEGGPVRRFILWSGRMGVRTQPSLSGKERFTLETGGMKC
ncbi:MAG: hypothetical protein H7145_21830, partial [Akkermansiaceae bacterium]|nr:hypothetical protein [Armatimonadota bacterium]